LGSSGTLASWIDEAFGASVVKQDRIVRMPTEAVSTAQQLRSLVKADGTLELSLAIVEVPAPQPNEVVIRVEASPINPSDLGLLFAGADMQTATVSGPTDNPIVSANIPAGAMRTLSVRVGSSLPVGNEGAGTVVDAGSSDAAQALMNKTVALAGGSMYTQYRCVDASQCLVLADGTLASEGASSFVNPLTALGMVETMRREGHRALVHTAAASNLGQMLNKLCIEEEVPLVNIVRRPEQEEILREIGAAYVCDSTSPNFMDELTHALIATSATLAFDATGGGKLAGHILTCMEAAATASATEYSRYGSTTHKQVYIYGGLDRGPTEFNRNFGMAWGIGGWLLTPFLQKIGPEAFQALRQRVAAELKTTFASTYTSVVSLAEALRLDAISVYGKQATGEKYLINPNKDPGVAL
jgi:NADPH2:quinone reductase